MPRRGSEALPGSAPLLAGADRAKRKRPTSRRQDHHGPTRYCRDHAIGHLRLVHSGTPSRAATLRGGKPATANDAKLRRLPETWPRGW